MVEENLLVTPFGWGVLILIFTSILLTYRVLFGPTLPDRIVGLNTITTKVVIMIAILSVINKQYFLIDLAVVLLMVNAVGGLILSKYLERRGKR
ncbi:cation:proton antiporter [Thermococcus sp. M39]|uniref:monovalent cation/H+ antiporter complex subunit F n=1 Tax=unclassified Thermococcus TaxID=2627626 RepID=UPI001438D859|nr:MULTISPECIES: monovalent cation/H+ antiporter complex subunit F [unclassified Thermococcus]NJE08529.1 cation:proton antiporter [Thermococcus sp. M39]NJE13127.1 cation:proton antiporter [Thermococcus sp. LS2]